MHRARGFLSAVVVVLLGLAAVGVVRSGAIAQEASPAPVFEIAPGVTAEALAFIPGQEEPSLYRLKIEPGVSYPFAASPAIELAYVEQGSFALTLSSPVTINSIDTPDAIGVQTDANKEFTIEAGDYITLPPGTSGEVRNDGTETASFTVADIYPAPSGTPAATPAS